MERYPVAIVPECGNMKWMLDNPNALLPEKNRLDVLLLAIKEEE